MYEASHDEEQGVSIHPPSTDGDNVNDEGFGHTLLAVDPNDPSSGASDRNKATPFAIPVWLREASASFRWRWVPLPLRKAAWATARWVKGPVPPLDLPFKPLFPAVQALPVRFLDRFFPKRRHKIVLLLLLYLSWFISWLLILLRSSVGNIEGYGNPNHISCGASFWYMSS
jgi:hypothetical protein